MSTPATAAINALLADATFNALVADLKQKRDEIANYQYILGSMQSTIATNTANLTAAQAAEQALMQQIQTSGAAIIAANL